jgi:Vitamin K epoxide reductase family
VLSSPYGQLWGLPLSALGAAAYAATAAVAAAGAAQRAAGVPEASNSARLPLLAAATSLVSISGYLMAVLATRLGGQACPYCLASAALSTATLASAFRQLPAAELRRLAAAGVALAAATVMVVALPQGRDAAAREAAASLEIPYREIEVRASASPTTSLT